MSGGTRDLHLAAERFDPIPLSADATAGAVGAADAVITHVDYQATVAGLHAQLGVWRLRVLATLVSASAMKK